MNLVYRGVQDDVQQECGAPCRILFGMRSRCVGVKLDDIAGCAIGWGRRDVGLSEGHSHLTDAYSASAGRSCLTWDIEWP